MGMHAMIKGDIARFKSRRSSNPRYLAWVLRRISGVAQTVEASGDTAQQQKLGETVQNITKQLAEVGDSSPSDLSGRLAHQVYLKERGILSGADRILDTFQKPPKDHAKIVEEAMAKDRKALGTLLDGLSKANDATLKSFCEMGSVSTEKPRTAQSSSKGRAQLRRESTLEVVQEQLTEWQCSQASTSAMSQASTLRNEEQAYAQFAEKLEEYKIGKREPSIVIPISTMGEECPEAAAHVVPLSQTFCGLADTFMEFGNEDFLPDFWSKEIDPTHNRVTPSGICFGWQDPSKKVMDAITKKGHLGIETVRKDVEYVVALVKEGDRENGMPIDIPRVRRLPTSEHFQQIFPDHIISQIRRLEIGDDASKVVFDSRSFRHQTAPLVVEMSAK